MMILEFVFGILVHNTCHLSVCFSLIKCRQSLFRFHFWRLWLFTNVNQKESFWGEKRAHYSPQKRFSIIRQSVTWWKSLLLSSSSSRGFSLNRTSRILMLIPEEKRTSRKFTYRDGSYLTVCVCFQREWKSLITFNEQLQKQRQQSLEFALSDIGIASSHRKEERILSAFSSCSLCVNGVSCSRFRRGSDEYCMYWVLLLHLLTKSMQQATQFHSHPFNRITISHWHMHHSYTIHYFLLLLLRILFCNISHLLLYFVFREQVILEIEIDIRCSQASQKAHELCSPDTVHASAFTWRFTVQFFWSNFRALNDFQSPFDRLFRRTRNYIQLDHWLRKRRRVSFSQNPGNSCYTQIEILHRWCRSFKRGRFTRRHGLQSPSHECLMYMWWDACMECTLESFRMTHHDVRVTYSVTHTLFSQAKPDNTAILMIQEACRRWGNGVQRRRANVCRNKISSDKKRRKRVLSFTVLRSFYTKKRWRSCLSSYVLCSDKTWMHGIQPNMQSNDTSRRMQERVPECIDTHCVSHSLWHLKRLPFLLIWHWCSSGCRRNTLLQTQEWEETRTNELDAP